MHPQFIDILKITYRYDFAVNILSNLTLLNDDMLDLMKTHHKTGVQVSLYSTNPDNHDTITKLKGSFYKTKDSILRLIKNDIHVLISCPVMKQNKHDLVDVMKWAQEYNLATAYDYTLSARYDGTTDNLDNRIEISDIVHIPVKNEHKMRKE